ncbi:hypothetical protein PRIPAC_78256 [Pristionchus pacificus]|nr:hypothetical protein PRIPAC_78256 [Pristionchus pacificus]
MDQYMDNSLDLPPERLPSDSIQLIFLLLVFAVGVPLNVATFRRLLALHKTRRKGSSRAAFVLLKLHLTLSDLMLLFFFVGPQLLWNLTYEWLLGDALRDLATGLLDCRKIV